jgi:hypothetical protein
MGGSSLSNAGMALRQAASPPRVTTYAMRELMNIPL